MSAADEKDVVAGQRARWRAEGRYGPELVSDLMDAAAVVHGDDQMIFASPEGDEVHTLATLDRHARGIAAYLLSRGLGPGTTVAVQLPDSPACLVAFRAVVASGARLVPIPAIYGPKEVGFILADCGARGLITADAWRSIDYLAGLPDVVEDTAVELVVVVGERVPPWCVAWTDLPKEPPAGQPPQRPDVAPEAEVAVIYTSGSTADPKGVRHSHESLVFELRQCFKPWRLDGSRWASVVPLGHMAGFLTFCRTMAFGGDTVFIDRWDAALVLDRIARYGITSGTFPPFHLTTLLDAARTAGVERLPLGDCLVGSTAVQAQLIRAADGVGCWGYRCYGSSEHPTISSGTEHACLDERADTDGRILHDVEVRILDEDGVDLPDGVEGEIVSTGPDLFLGYTDPAATAAAFTDDGWYRTGDIGLLQGDVLTITGRRKDLIIRGGENLSPKEIEDVLGTHPAVLEVAVVGAPDPLYGERPWAFVITRDDAALDLEQVRTHFVAAGIARQKTPEGLTLLDDFPRTAAGKIRKNDLRRMLAQAT